MTKSKIPPAPRDVGKLSLVFDSLYASVAATPKPVGGLALPKLKSAVCVLIDGFGASNLRSRSGHAKVLFSYFNAQRRTLRCEFPSTTVVSLAGFSTGLRSSGHGLIGYNVKDPKTGALTNLLSGWERDGAQAENWKQYETISERTGSVNVHVVANPEYQRSGFTSLTMPKAQFHAVQDLEDRVQTAQRLGSIGGNLVYLYIPELDQIGHIFGSESPAWSEVLEQIDSALASLLQSRVPVVITSDHGMVDVPIENQIHLETFDFYSDLVNMTGGDTRSSFLYTDNAQPLAELLEEQLGDLVWISNWSELSDLGYVGSGTSIDGRYPDLVLLARGKVTLYDRRFARPRSLQMLGHHGSISDSEMQVPLILAGDLSF